MKAFEVDRSVVLEEVGFFLDPAIGLDEWLAEWQESASVIVDCVWGLGL